VTTRVGGLVLGITVLALGALLLLRNLGVLPADVTVGPVLLIAVGVALVIGALDRSRERPAAEPVERASASLEGVAEARIDLAHGAGYLTVTDGAPTGLLYEGTFAGGVRASVSATNGRADVRLRHQNDPERWFRTTRGLAWTVTLSDGVPVDLSVRTGASRVRLDLERLMVRSLALQVGAADVDVVLPRHGPCSAKVTAGAADVRIRVPEGTQAAIMNRSALASVSIDRDRFPARNGGFRSDGYDEAADHVDVEIEGGVAAFSVR
jgi:hypothetical protein